MVCLAIQCLRMLESVLGKELYHETKSFFCASMIYLAIQYLRLLDLILHNELCHEAICVFDYRLTLIQAW